MRYFLLLMTVSCLVSCGSRSVQSAPSPSPVGAEKTYKMDQIIGSWKSNTHNTLIVLPNQAFRLSNDPVPGSETGPWAVVGGWVLDKGQLILNNATATPNVPDTVATGRITLTVEPDSVAGQYKLTNGAVVFADRTDLSAEERALGNH